ncbi:MAG TPA: SH3 domain-containing protein [Thermomicrobiales bacterium]|nr:SH3 domain-containing protein [Thermomicrobiales bacterium]
MGANQMPSDVSVSTVTAPGVTGNLSRRRFAGMLAGGAFAAIAAGGFARSAGAQSDRPERSTPTGNWVTTAALNLRESASTSSRVLAVIPAGTALVTYSGEQNGFRSTVYGNQTGWVAVAYLKNAGNSGSSDGPDPSQSFAATATVSVATNFRTGASTGSSVIQVVAANTVVNIGTQIVNGFRAVSIGGRLGWMIDSSLRQGGGGNPPPTNGGATGPATINSAANFRMDPSYGNNVIRVLPAGTAVTLSGRVSGDFVEVSTPGDIGWVYGPLVTRHNPNTQQVTYRATATLNMREQSSASSRLVGVLPAGATCTGPQVSANGYTPVTYNGQYGFVLTQYLVRV